MLSLKKNTVNLLLTVFLISFFSFFIIFNKFYLLSLSNNLFLIIPLIIILLSISSYLILIISIPINIKVVKKFYLENRKLLLSIFILITIYIVSYFILPAKITYHSVLLNFIFKDINLSNFIFKNFIVFFLIIFILNIFLINQLKFQEKEVFNILLKFSLFFLILGILQNIIYFWNTGNQFSEYFSDTENCIYFQFLPYGIAGKRNYEIIPFILGYTLTQGLFKNKYIFLNLFFFVACFLSYSKNLWITLVFINIISFFIFDKIRFLKHLFLKLLVLISSVLILNIAMLSKDNCNPNINKYTKVKIISLINIIENKYLNSIKNEALLELTSFKLYFQEHNYNDEEFIANTNYLLDSTAPRLLIYEESLKKISKKILSGYGPNNYILKSNNSSNSESEFLKIILDIGIIGILLWLYLFIQLFKNCKSKWSLLMLSSIMSLSLFNIYSWFLPIYFILTCVIFFERNVRTRSIL